MTLELYRTAQHLLYKRQHLDEGLKDWFSGSPEDKDEIHYNPEMKLFHGKLGGDSLRPMSKKKFYSHLVFDRGMHHSEANKVISHLMSAQEDHSEKISHHLRTAGKLIQAAHRIRNADRDKSEGYWRGAESHLKHAESLGFNLKDLKPHHLEDEETLRKRELLKRQPIPKQTVSKTRSVLPHHNDNNDRASQHLERLHSAKTGSDLNAALHHLRSESPHIVKAVAHSYRGGGQKPTSKQRGLEMIVNHFAGKSLMRQRTKEAERVRPW